MLVDEESLNNYSHDETENLHFPPEVVIKPRTAEEISAILKICNKEKILLLPVEPARVKWWGITSSWVVYCYQQKE